MLCLSLFFLRDASSTATYTLSLHDALPIYRGGPRALPQHRAERRDPLGGAGHGRAGRLGRRPLVARAHPALSVDRKSTRLNSSHTVISYAVFCLKKKSVAPSGDPNDPTLSG